LRSQDLPSRPRRNRRSRTIRDAIREVAVTPANLILPIFVHDADENVPIPSMPGVERLSFKNGVISAVKEARSYGVNQVVIFPKVSHLRPLGPDTVSPSHRLLLIAIHLYQGEVLVSGTFHRLAHCFPISVGLLRRSDRDPSEMLGGCQPTQNMAAHDFAAAVQLLQASLEADPIVRNAAEQRLLQLRTFNILSICETKSPSPSLHPDYTRTLGTKPAHASSTSFPASTTREGDIRL
jgi:hypothetical protein